MDMIMTFIDVEGGKSTAFNGEGEIKIKTHNGLEIRRNVLENGYLGNRAEGVGDTRVTDDGFLPLQSPADRRMADRIG